MASEDIGRNEQQEELHEPERAVQGDAVRRDKVVMGDEIHGDKVGRDKITITEEQAYNVSGLPNPYLGLKSYEYQDRFAYAGRDTEIRDAISRLTKPGEQQVLLFVTGASGSGKSSFAQAGLIPALESHYQKRHKEVRRAVMRPGTRPLTALADALEQLGLPQLDSSSLEAPDALSFWLIEHTPENQINLIVIDQFEEIFTQSPIDQRQKLFHFLIKLQDFDTLLTNIIITIRSDYLGDLFENRELWEIAKLGVELRTMTRTELKEAILSPLTAVGKDDEHLRQKRFEAALLDRLSVDAAENAVYLPLLQVCLGGLWNGGNLTLGNYDGLAAAIQERAEAVFVYRDYDLPNPKEKRDEEDQEAILSIFLDLVSVSLDEEVVRDVRRRRIKHDLATDGQRIQLLDDLIDARLLGISVDQDVEMVEIIHESLINNWERLKGAIDNFRERLRQRARFELALGEWLTHYRSNDYLLGGIRLAEAKALEDVLDIAFASEDAQEFLLLSQKHAERELQRLRVRNRIITIVGIMALAAAILAFYFGYRADMESQSNAFLADMNARIAAENADIAETNVAVANTAEAASTLAVAGKATAEYSKAEAQRQARIAHAGELSALVTNKLDRELDLALLLSVEAFKTEDMLQTESALYQAWSYNSALIAFLQGDIDTVLSVAWSSDGRLASSGADGMVRVWDLKKGNAPQLLSGHTGPVYSVAWSGDGQLVSGGEDGTVRLWDLDSGKATQVLNHISAQDKQAVLSVAWSEDGRLATGGEYGRVEVWDITSEKVIHRLISRPDLVMSLAWSGDGRLAVGGTFGSVQVWDPESDGGFASVRLEGHSGDGLVYSVVWSYDPKTDNWRLASGSCGEIDNFICHGELIVWDIESGQVALMLNDFSGAIRSMALSEDGRLATGGGDGAVRVWDIDAEKELQVFEGSGYSVYSIAWSEDGKLATGGSDGRVRVWDLENVESATVLEEYLGIIRSVAWSKDGYLASSKYPGGVLVWNFDTSGAIEIIDEHTGVEYSMAWSGDGRLAIGGGDGVVRVWDLENEVASEILEGHTGTVFSVAWSRDGRLASSWEDGIVRVWDLENEVASEILEGHTGIVHSVAWSSDGRLASGGEDGLVQIWDLENEVASEILEGHTGIVYSVAWSDDGRLASSGQDGTVRVWEIEGGNTVEILEGHTNDVHSVAWSKDGRLASGSRDSTVRVWNLGSAGIVQVLEGHTRTVHCVAWSGDGRLASGGDDGKVRVWELNPEVWLLEACQRAGRNLTRAEWERYLYWKPFDPKYKTCPQWPSPAELESTQ
jgi:WD40 repeat protein